eukprot:14102-Heterococcus_DN1.PRE.4
MHCYVIASVAITRCTCTALTVSPYVRVHDKQAVDYHVVRYPGAVSWFAPGSYASRPPLQTCIPNLVCAGDWVSVSVTSLIHTVMQCLAERSAL